MWNKDKVLAKIGVDGKIDAAVVERAVYTVWLGQTADEKRAGDVKHDNRRGLSTRTRFVGSKLGSILQGAVDIAGHPSRVKWGTVIWSRTWQDHAIEVARHHAAQIARVWNEMNKAQAA
jgi:hypothetical protein